MPYKLTWLPAVLRAAGLHVIEVPGWQDRGHDDMGEVRGILCHHTAECRDTNTEPSLKIITEGRPGLSGPLANLGLGQAGDYWMVAAGRAWHSGPGKYRGITKGNMQLIGIEAENDGIGEPWPEVQMVAFAKGCAAIAKHLGFGADMVIGHKEYALPKGRKIDPSFDMDQFRQRVAGYMGAIK